MKKKVVEMSSRGRRQCRNNPDVCYYICGEYTGWPKSRYVVIKTAVASKRIKIVLI